MLKPSMQDFKHDLTSMGCCCCCCVASVVSDSVRPHRWQPTRLLCPWDSPGKNTGVGCHFLLKCMKVKSESEVAQSCPTLLDPLNCSLPGSSAHGIFQARVLEWGAIAFSVLAWEMSTIVWWLEYSLVLPFLGCRMRIDFFQSCGHCWVFQICWHWTQHLDGIILKGFERLYSNSIASLALLTAVLPKAHLTSHYRMSGSGWLTTPLS